MFQVALEVLELLAPRCHISPICKELFHLLQKPHLQVIIYRVLLCGNYFWARAMHILRHKGGIVQEGCTVCDNIFLMSEVVSFLSKHSLCYTGAN